jgi:hypothetical protein
MPSVSAVPGDTIVGQKVIFAFLETSGTQKNYRCKVASISRTLNKIERKVPDTDGSLIIDRSVVTEKTIAMKLTLDELSTDAATQFLSQAQAIGTGRLFVKDPSDAALVASILTNEFNCSVTLEGDLTLQADQFTEFTLNVAITGTFTITRDGVIT